MNRVQILYRVLFVGVLCCTTSNFAMQWAGSWFWDYDTETVQKSSEIQNKQPLFKNADLESEESDSDDCWVIITKTKIAKKTFVEQLCAEYQKNSSEYVTESHKAVFKYNAVLVTAYKQSNCLHSQKIEQATIALYNVRHTEEYRCVKDIMGLTAAEWEDKLATVRLHAQNYVRNTYKVAEL